MRSLPQSMHDRARRLAEVHPLATVAQLLRVHPSQVTKMKQRRWIAPPDGRPVRAMPTDFAIQAGHMNQRELVDHYGAGSHTIVRWCRELREKRR
ncbi:hypothetical protein [Sphingobium yanoikuyae]|uniref:Uncharacterized protein n=1 Tax=Sphingobium yanoikuyae TaxID=13690 RepID=A0A9X7UGQ0_SPHYA|nr:hypothetical protein [Sphingobium yanoikuyae]QNG46170.1 hypothetical protein H3V42_00330 [Sphingobium yanoikuyae]